MLVVGTLTACLPPAKEGDIAETATSVKPPTRELPGTLTPDPTLEAQANNPCGPIPSGDCHVITSLCLRCGDCVEVCPVECIVPGKPEAKWPWYYIDPDTCIDCGACVPECPYEAIFPEDEVPAAYRLHAGQERVPAGGARYVAAGGEVVDLRQDISCNAAFFRWGPGYKAKEN